MRTWPDCVTLHLQSDTLRSVAKAIAVAAQHAKRPNQPNNAPLYLTKHDLLHLAEVTEGLADPAHEVDLRRVAKDPEGRLF